MLGEVAVNQYKHLNFIGHKHQENFHNPFQNPVKLATSK